MTHLYHDDNTYHHRGLLHTLKKTPASPQYIIIFLCWFLAVNPVRGQIAPSDRPNSIQFQTQRQVGDRIFEFEGMVIVEWPNMTVQADFVRWDQKRRWVEAEGDVVVIKGDLHLTGSRLELNLATQEARVFNASAFHEPQVSGRAQEVFKTPDDIFKLKSAYVTECHARVPHWSVSAHRVTIKPDDYAQFTHALVRIKSIPIFYLPYLRIPIKRERSTGFLFPKFGPNSSKGFFLEIPFFWAISRSQDLTLAARMYARRGFGGSAEYRYVLSEHARGNLRANAFHDTTFGNQWDVNWNHQMALGKGWTWSINTDWFSSFDFRQDFGNNFFQRSQRQRQARTYISGRLGLFQLFGQVDIQDTRFAGGSTVLTGRLPQIQATIYNRKFGPFSFSLNSSYAYLRRASGQDILTFHRADMNPRISIPLSTPWLSFTPSITLQGTFYSRSIDSTTGDLLETDLFRRFFETTVDLRGPVFFRIFNLGQNAFTDRIKHVIEPFARYRYGRAFFDEDLRAPGFDRTDFLRGSHNLNVGIIQRLYIRRDAGSGAPMPWEYLTWSVSQNWVFPSQSFDPEKTPFLPRYGPIQNRIRWNPNPITSFDAGLDIHPRTWTVTQMSLTGSMRTNAGHQLTIAYVYNRSLSFNEEGTTAGPARQQIRGNLLTYLGNTFQIQIGSSYDISRKQLLSGNLGIIYQADCFSLGVQVQRFQFGGRAEYQFQFSLSIPHVGNLLQFAPGFSGIY